MLCKQTGCTGDMKYRKTPDNERYVCPVCGFSTLILPHDISTDGLEGMDDYLTYDERGNLCIDDGIVEAYFKLHP